MLDLKKEKNFFETRVIEYQAGGTLSWEDWLGYKIQKQSDEQSELIWATVWAARIVF
jgi:hypothetical protein